MISRKEKTVSSFFHKILHRSFLMVMFSLFIHFLSYKLLNRLEKKTPPPSKFEKIKIKIVQDKAKKKKTSSAEKEDIKQIIEAKLKKTSAPKKDAYLGAQDHIAKKKMKAKKKFTPKKESFTQTNKIQKQVLKPKKSKDKAKQTQNKQHKPQRKKHVPLKETSQKHKGQLALKSKPKESTIKKTYDDLLKNSFDLLHTQNNNSYQDYIDDENIEEGDIIDLSTKEYRYIGYFTSLRKAIELAWVYPSIAIKRGNQGKVILKFTIHKNGIVSNIELLSSSGYPILDNSIVQAIQLAAPFPPLPKSFEKSFLTISGSFTYLLSSFAGGN